MALYTLFFFSVLFPRIPHTNAVVHVSFGLLSKEDHCFIDFR